MVEKVRAVEFFPEELRVAHVSFGELAKPSMPLTEHEGFTACFERRGVTCNDRLHDVVVPRRRIERLKREGCARREAHQVHGVRHRCRFIEVVEAPDEATFGIAPRAKIFHVDVAHRQHPRRVVKVGAEGRETLGEAKKGRPHERKNAFTHAL